MILKTKLPVKIPEFHETEKKNSIEISVFGYENNEKHPSYVSKRFCEQKHVEKKERDTMCWSKILTLSCMIILYIVEENIFVDIVYELLVQKKY